MMYKHSGVARVGLGVDAVRESSELTREGSSSTQLVDTCIPTLFPEDLFIGSCGEIVKSSTKMHKKVKVFSKMDENDIGDVIVVCATKNESSEVLIMTIASRHV